MRGIDVMSQGHSDAEGEPFYAKGDIEDVRPGLVTDLERLEKNVYQLREVMSRLIAEIDPIMTPDHDGPHLDAGRLTAESMKASDEPSTLRKHVSRILTEVQATTQIIENTRLKVQL